MDFKQASWTETTSEGVGRADGEFLMPLELLHTLTGNQRMELHVRMREGTENAFAKYGSFGVADASDKFRLSVGEYADNSSAGDSLLYHNGAQWSSSDQDNDTWGDTACTAKCFGPNWFKSCHKSNPLGKYGNSFHCRGINWNSFKGKKVSLDYIEYLVRPNPCL